MKFVLITVLLVALSHDSQSTPKSAHSRKRRIAGGSEVPDGLYPFVVSLQDLFGHFCAGSIVSDSVVLTAAHCTFREDFFIRAGSVKALSGGSVHTVRLIARHEHYKKWMIENSTSVINDLALIKIEPSIQPSEQVGKIQLIGRNESVIEGTNVTLLGWGATQNTHEGDFIFSHAKYGIRELFEFYEMSHYYSETLKNANATIIPRSECMRHFTLAENQICTYSTNGVGCAGDSGGPLMFNERQIGIKNGGGNSCSPRESIDVYFNLMPYLDWIDQKVRALESLPEDSNFIESFIKNILRPIIS
ncbi:hypothetical protein QAD02_005708 [Eretmocerus hayati]|uniref:Uncharacterized protein n=1 Tax=Eretmocerus hayati TaxID=131215 RepID=A0ACC2NUD4_9HYME|nr:hypothetical protein QAD02_005708 [Eretmocerus hayati]